MRCDHVGGHGGQGIVVAKAQLLDRDGVVFVDDRQDLPGEHGKQSVADIEVAVAVGKVTMGEQDLGHLLPQAAEDVLVLPHQADLTQGGGGLLLAHDQGAMTKPQALAAGGHSPGRDQHHLAALGHQGPKVPGEVGHDLKVQAIVIGQHRAAHLDHHPLGLGQQLPAPDQALLFSHLKGHLRHP